MRQPSILTGTLFAVLLVASSAVRAQPKPLKVFILAGQSNMEGHARIETFDYIGDDPATAPLLKRMRGADGSPTVCDQVWISYFTGIGDSNGEGFGKLTAGYGSRQTPGENGGKIGPEFTFGLTLDEQLNEPVLIIKTAWGGKSLHTDFRSPSAGPYVLSEWQKEHYPKQEGHGIPKDFEKWKADKIKETGVYYRLMIEHVKRVLADPQRVCPAYDPAAGYEISGFVWLQGWNDMVDGHVYPHPKQGDATPRFASYSDCLSHFIRDVRHDLSAPQMPFVIGVMGVGGAKAGADVVAFREAMTAPVLLPEFQGNVTAVPTAPFWSEELGAIDEKHGKVRQMGYYLDSMHKDYANADGTMTAEQKREFLKKFEADLISPAEVALWKRGASNAGYHYLGCAKTFALMGKRFAEASLAMLNSPKERAAAAPAAEPREGEMAGYLLVPNEKVPETFDAGFSMYVAAWPLLKQYPGQRFQSGLPGTWMFAQPVGKPLKKGYSDIEGGLGWWRDTEYATETPKFIMGGVAPDFVEWANGPGAGKGRDWAKPNGKYAVAQLSPWVLWPPDGLNLKQGTRGEWFGYGYLPLPLTQPKAKTDGKEIPTGNHCWTLFLNTGNFKGPVTFFTPYFWSRNAVRDPRFAGQLLDTRPSDPNRALQMETQHIPSVQATDSKGVTYARVSPTQFPSDAQGDSALVHRVTSYNKQALWDAVQAWFDGGPVASGEVKPEGAALHEFPGHGGATWQIYPDGTQREEKFPVAWNSFATPFAPDRNTFGYKWNLNWVKRDDSTDRHLVVLPEFFRLGVNDKQKSTWSPVTASEVPAETGLANTSFDRKRNGSPKTYVTPEDTDSCWKKPGPKAGPFQARPGDGSVVTYSWYRFADQPALLNADMTDAEREAIQKRVELLHRHWSNDRNYLAPPAKGELADIDPALIVIPPAGMEFGYVPIVTRQEPDLDDSE
ncbi:MAG: sialate O-acetylesterase [Planctomycetaceae bacterium]|nr:sialate O-acetylesterase [Planctomycetaceae bacterium]